MRNDECGMRNAECGMINVERRNGFLDDFEDFEAAFFGYADKQKCGE